ncbi:MAG: class I SAM-dependent methyltransferase [Myxococcota bacterium]
MHDLDATRRSWNVATRNHNAHKGDQVAFFREGGDVLFPEELELLGELGGVAVVHLQCNAGQDTLGLARRGALVTGVDLSDEAVAFARALSAGSGIPATFVEADVVAWMQTTPERFDVAFSSYGAAPWLPDLAAWASGIARVLNDGGRFVYVEFHPLVWSFGGDLRLSRDDYFQATPFVEPVGDYVAASGAGLGAVTPATTVANTVPAQSWQHGLGDFVTALAAAGLRVELVREYPHSNGCKVIDALVPADGRRWVWPEGTARVPLMFGLVARKG